MFARRAVRSLLAAVLLLGVLAPAAEAEFPYPSPPPGTDPYDYGSYMKTRNADDLPPDMDGGERWKYSSKRACQLYPQDPSKCDPIAEANPQELNQVTGASVDKAWTTTTGRPDVIIGVVDSGIEWDNRDDMRDLAAKTWLNPGELPLPGTDTYGGDERAHDANGDGVFNIEDYCQGWQSNAVCEDGRVTDLNKTGYVDPEDLIFRFSDGVDQDGNGYVDDFVGWDAYEDDNDPYDEVHYGHGTGEAIDSTAEANNGESGVGSCPNCMVMHLRVGDSFIGDVNDFAQGVVYGTDNGASVIQSALGTLNNSRFAQEAINYAWRRGVALLASAADESAGHHNQPSVLEHGITMNSSGEPQGEGLVAGRPASYMEFRGCTNYGAYISVTVPSNSCSSEAVGRGAGMAALAYAAARNAVDAGTIADYGTLDGPAGVFTGQGISAEELDQLIVTTADDYNFTSPPYTERTLPETKRYGATPGWDPFFGYGRINTRRMVEAVRDNRIPPEADITSPEWFEIKDPDAGPVEVKGLVASRRSDKYSYTLEWATWSGSWRGPREAYRTPAWKSTGVTLSYPGDQSTAREGLLATVSSDAIKAEMTAQNGPVGAFSGPGVDPATGRGDHQNVQWPDKFGIILRLTVTAKNELGVPLITKYDSPDGGGDPNVDRTVPGPLIGVATKNFNFHDDPALFPGFPRDMVGDGAAAPRFADIDDDGTDELIVATSDGIVHAYESGGGEAEGWPARTTQYSLNYDAPAYRSGEITVPVHAATLRSPTVADLDRDGDLEVVVPDFEGRIAIFDKRGRLITDEALEDPNYPFRSNPVYSSPQPEDRAAGFYDNNPQLVPGDFPGYPAALPNDPDLVPDLVNRRLDGQYDAFESGSSSDPNRTIWWMLPSPNVGNLDDDDELEILAGSSDGHIYQWNLDGTLRPGWPVKQWDPSKLDDKDSIDPVTHMVKDDEQADRLQGGPVVVSAALGDTNGDGKLEIFSTVNEEYREPPNTDDKVIGNLPAGLTPGNQRFYRLFRNGFLHEPADSDPNGKRVDKANHPHDTAYVRNWPMKIVSVQPEILPVVGEGPTGAPIIGDAVQDPGREISIFGTVGPQYLVNDLGNSVYGKDERGRDRTLQTDQVGAGSNSPDAPSIPAVGGSIFTVDGPGALALVSPAAGLGKLLDLLLPEDQLVSDNQLGVWDLRHPAAGQPGYRGQLPAFPREVNDLQFLTTATSADIDGDGLQEVLAATAYSDLHAFSIAGEEPGMKTLSPTGWPKFTGGWSVSPTAVGDWDGDRKRDTAHVIREGYLFAWKGAQSGADVCDPATWPEYGHDNWNSNAVNTDASRPRVITDLKVLTSDGSNLMLGWTAPGDDGVCGRAHSYEIRRSTEPLTNENFEGAELVGRKPAAAPDSQESALAKQACGTYYYGVRTWDADPATDTPAAPANPSAVSNSVVVTPTGSGCVTPTPRPSPTPTPTPTETRTPSATPSTSSSVSPPPQRGRARSNILVADGDDKVRFAEPFTLFGRVTGSQGCAAPYEISLEKRVHGTTTWRPVADATTDGQGRWSVSTRSRKSADYLAEVASTQTCVGETSEPEQVGVRAGVTVRPPTCEQVTHSGATKGDGRLTIRGRVAPNKRGTKVALQRRKPLGGWRTFDTDRLDARSRYTLNANTCKGRFRVVWRKQDVTNLRGDARFRL